MGFEIYEDKVPVLSEIKGVKDLDPRELAFYYGGDYELLFTMDMKALETEELLKRIKGEVKMSIIGKVVPSEEGIYFKKGEGKKKEMMEIKGYQHF